MKIIYTEITRGDVRASPVRAGSLEGLLTYVLRGEDPRGSLNGNISGM